MICTECHARCIKTGPHEFECPECCNQFVRLPPEADEDGARDDALNHAHDQANDR